MAEVYRARDSHLCREVALKLLFHIPAMNPQYLKRFEREARTASSLNHPNVATVYDMDVSGPIPYIAMELAKGPNLRQLVSVGRLDQCRVVDLAIQIADRLASVHKAEVVHRDLKPENLMLSENGLVKILDFGVAQVSTLSCDSTVEVLTQPGGIVGTVAYMSPEQLSGVTVDFRSDQFSLGIVLYEIATGHHLFVRATKALTIAAIMHDSPEPPSQRDSTLSAQLSRIIEQALAKEPSNRFASTYDMVKELTVVRDLQALEYPTPSLGTSAGA